MSKPIYIYITPFFPEPGRHYGSYGYDFVQALKRNSDYDVRVFVPGKGNDYDFEGCHVYRFPVKHLPSAILPFLFENFNRQSFLKALIRVGIKVQDIAFCHGNTAAFSIYPLAVKSTNPRCLTLLHHHSLDAFGLRLGKFRHFWLHKVINFFKVRSLYEQIDCHIFISEACRNSTIRFPDTQWSEYADYRRLGRGLGFFRPAAIKKYVILWNGVDTRKFNSLGRLPHNTSSRFVIGCVGNFIEVKDHITLIKAIEMLKFEIPSLRLDILGTNGVGKYCRDAKLYVERNGLSDIVRFLPNVSQDKMPDFYRSWDLLVMPSYFEGFGCVYLESWACGTPFIACKGQGIEDVLSENERGKWLCNPHDAMDVAKKIKECSLYTYPQILRKDVSIDSLVAEYVEKIERIPR